MRKLGKRGGIIDSIYFVIFETLLVVAIGIFMMIYVIATADNTLFEKQVISRDLALLTNVIEASPGNIVYTYTQLPEEFSAQFIQAGVIIRDLGEEEDPIPIGYAYILDTNHKLIGINRTFANEAIILQKQENLEIGTDNIAQIKCPTIDKIETQKLKEISIVPKYHQEYDFETQQKEKAITQSIADTFKNIDGYVVTKIEDTENQIISKARKDISIQIVLNNDKGKEEAPDNVFNINYQFDKDNLTSTLSCLIMKEISKKQDIVIGQINKIEDANFNYGFVAIEIEAGNLESDYNFESGYLDISNAITKALKQYNG